MAKSGSWQIANMSSTAERLTHTYNTYSYIGGYLLGSALVRISAVLTDQTEAISMHAVGASSGDV